MNRNREQYFEQQIRDLRKRLNRLTALALSATGAGADIPDSVFHDVSPLVAPWTHTGGWGGLIFTDDAEDTAPLHPIDPHSLLGVTDKPHGFIREVFADEAARLAWTAGCANLAGAAVWQLDTDEIYMIKNAATTPADFILLNGSSIPFSLWQDAGAQSGTATHTLTVADNLTNQTIFTPMRILAHDAAGTWQFNLVTNYSAGTVLLCGDGITTGTHTIYYCVLPAAVLERGYGHARPPDGYIFPAPALIPTPMRVLAASVWTVQAGSGTKIKLWITSDCNLTTVTSGAAVHNGSGFDGDNLELLQAVNGGTIALSANQLMWTEIETAGGAGFVTVQLVYLPDFIAEALDL